MGLFAAIGGLFAGNAMKKASQKATDAQITAINRGIDLQQQQYAETEANFAPFLSAGTSALGKYGNLLGNNGVDAQAKAVADLKASPFFQQQLADANENLLQTASATGGVRGGNTAGAIAELSPALLSQYYQNALSGYGSLANMGLGATGNVGQFGAANAQSVSNLYGDIGTAKARNYITRGGINAANITNFGGVLDDAAKNLVGYAFPGLNGITKGGTLATNGAAKDLIASRPGIF